MQKKSDSKATNNSGKKNKNGKRESTKAKTHNLDTQDKALYIESVINEAKNFGVKRNYPKAISLLEDLTLSEPEFLRTHSIALYKVYLLLCRAYAAIENYPRSIVYGKMLLQVAGDDAIAFFFVGRTYLLQKDYKKAIYYFEKSLYLKPNNLETLSLVAYACLKAKLTDDAISYFEKALTISPNNPKLLNGYLNSLFVSGVKHFKNGSYELARQIFNYCIESGIDGVAPRLYLAHSLYSLKEYPAALKQYNMAIEISPNDTSLQWYKALTLLQMGDMQTACEVLSNLGLPIEGDSVTEQFIALGAVRQHIQKGDWARAIVSARLYTKAFGVSTEIHLLTAIAQKNLKKVNLAVNHYLRANELEPENPIVYYGLFDLFTETFNWDGMQKLLVNADKVKSLNPDDIYFYKVITASHIDNPPEQVLPHLQALVQSENYAASTLLYNALGVCYVKLGLPELAQNWYKKTLLQKSNDEEALIGLIACYEALSQTDSLTKTYDDYLLNYPSNKNLRKEYIELLSSLENWDQVISQIETLATITGHNQDGELAYALRKNGEYKKAALLYQNMLKNKPEEKLLLHNFVYCLDKLGQTKTAINLLQLARQTFGEHEDSIIIEGILCLHCNRKEDALRLFQYVAERNPKNEVAIKYVNQTKKLFT